MVVMVLLGGRMRPGWVVADDKLPDLVGSSWRDRRPPCRSSSLRRRRWRPCCCSMLHAAHAPGPQLLPLSMAWATQARP